MMVELSSSNADQDCDADRDDTVVANNDGVVALSRDAVSSSFPRKGQETNTSSCISCSPRFIRQALLIVTALSTLFLVGAPFGWGPFQLLLEQHGTFADVCLEEELVSNDDTTDTTAICSAQTDKLLRIALVAQLSLITAPALGIMYDAIGAPRVAIVMAVTSLSGLALVAVAVSPHENDFSFLLYLGFPLLTLTGSMGSLLIVGLGFYFQDHSASRVIFILNTLFDSGAMTFWILWFFQDVVVPQASLFSIWMGYLVVAAIIHGAGSLLWYLAVPQQQEKQPQQKEEQGKLAVLPKDDEVLEDPSTVIASGEGGDTRNDVAPAPSSLKRRSNRDLDSRDGSTSIKDENASLATMEEESPDYQRDSLLSVPFLCLLTFFAIHVMGVSWNFATQRDFLGHLGDDDYDNRYLTIFTLSTPLSILGAPLMDWCILHLGWIPSMHVVNGLALAYSLIKVVTTNLNAQIVGFVLFSFCRSFIFGISFSFLPHVVSGPVIGRAQGIMTGLAGLLCLVNIPMASLAVKKLDGDFFWPNVFYVIVYIPCAVSVVMLGKCWKKDRDSVS